MDLKAIRNLAVIGVVLLATGCASSNVKKELDASFWQSKEQAMGIAIATLPKPDHIGTGNQGLLDLAINKGNAKPIVDHMQTMNLSDYNKAVPEITDALKAQGFKAVPISENIAVESLAEFDAPDGAGDKAFEDRDFRPLKEKFGVDRLILVTMTAVGTQRNYYGFVPTGAPVAITRATCELIDLSSNELLWRKPFSQEVNVEAPWDQPPSYPNLTRAVEKAMLMSRKSFPSAFDPALATKETNQVSASAK